jgi:hypothetical protein
MTAVDAATLSVLSAMFREEIKTGPSQYVEGLEKAIKIIEQVQTYHSSVSVANIALSIVTIVEDFEKAKYGDRLPEAARVMLHICNLIRKKFGDGASKPDFESIAIQLFSAVHLKPFTQSLDAVVNILNRHFGAGRSCDPDAPKGMQQ